MRAQWRTIAALALGVMGIAANAHAQTTAEPPSAPEESPERTAALEVEPSAGERRPLRIGVAGNPPFVVRGPDRVEGIALEVWAAIADRLGVDYELVPLATSGAAVDALAAGQVDAAIGPISITADRARRVAFTQPYWEADLAILAPVEGVSGWDRFAPFASRAFVVGVLSLAAILLLVGTLLWLAERKQNDTFPMAASRGIGEGVWLALVTMTTVGYGDRVPLTRAGRVITGVWMVVAMITASSLTAGIATALTLSQLEHARIETADQLRGLSVATVDGTTAARFARRHGARVIGRADAASAARAVASGDADAAVFDRPILQYVLREHPELQLRLSDASYEPQRYGFAFPVGSELRHEVSITLLELIETGHTESIAASWL